MSVVNLQPATANGDLHFELFSRFLGGTMGKQLILRANAFVNLLVPAGTRRSGPAPEVMSAYRGPFAERADRLPTYVLPREIVGSRDFPAEVEAGLDALRDLPALILWGDRDIAFRAEERRRFEALFPITAPWCSRAPAITSRRTRPRRSSRRSSGGEHAQRLEHLVVVGLG